MIRMSKSQSKHLFQQNQPLFNPSFDLSGESRLIDIELLEIFKFKNADI